MITPRVTIENLAGATDAGLLQEAHGSVPKVDSVEIHLVAKEALVRHDGADLHRLTVAVAEIGYPGRVAD